MRLRATDAPNDQFDHDQHVDVVLVQESRPPLVTTLMNRSAFSVDEVVINAAGVPSPWDGRETWIARIKCGARTLLIKVKVGEDGAPYPSLLKVE